MLTGDWRDQDAAVTGEAGVTGEAAPTGAAIVVEALSRELPAAGSSSTATCSPRCPTTTPSGRQPARQPPGCG